MTTKTPYELLHQQVDLPTGHPKNLKRCNVADLEHLVSSRQFAVGPLRKLIDVMNAGNYATVDAAMRDGAVAFADPGVVW